MKSITTEAANEAKAVSERTYRPRVSYYHPNGRGTGGAMTLTLIPATNLEGGGLMLELARQKTIGTKDGEVRTFPRFDWENRITLKMDMTDATKMLEVFRGCHESIDDGKGLFARGEKHTAIFKMEHRIEPMPGYLLEAHRKENGEGGKEDKAWIVLTMTESLGLSLAIEQSMAAMAFGINNAAK